MASHPVLERAGKGTPGKRTRSGALPRQGKPVDTNGGTWRTTRYEPRNIADSRGCTIDIEFEPKDPVVADKIGLVQTVKMLHNTSPGGAVDQIHQTDAAVRALCLTAEEGDVGRGIDRGSYDPKEDDRIPNTNPLYGVENTADHVSETLTDSEPRPEYATLGHRKLVEDGPPDVQVAKLGDEPRRTRTRPDEEIDGKFETTALVLDGPLKDVYLGSVGWGFKVDATGEVTLDPEELTVRSAGAPTSDFMDAARKWNRATLPDPHAKGDQPKEYQTVDLPLTGVHDWGTLAPAKMTVAELVDKIPAVEGQLAGLTGTDRANKEFEKSALETELRKRLACVEVEVVKQHEGGRNEYDKVFVRLEGGSGREECEPFDMIAGNRRTFYVALGSLVPFSGSIQVKVMEKEAGDDFLAAEIDWHHPFDPAQITGKDKDHEYKVSATFRKPAR